MAPRAARSNEVWYVDGHNVLLNIPELERAHTQDSLAARETLADRCRRFGIRRRLRVVVVFDGKTGVRGGETDETNLRVIYAAETGKADERIVRNATRAAQSGKHVVVVTDDRGIKTRLPKGAKTHGVSVFWRLSAPGATEAAGESGGKGRSRKQRGKKTGRHESKPTTTDPDIAEHFLAREKETLDSLPRTRRGRRIKKRGGAS